ncbi:cytochrome P450 [Nocardioides sp.]|uniref:cytochrome P450 n=1 Tax=Nocardioides sp. TaxID=35761 RepID=UPI002B82D713|nr:cytochrome P450 [Nocardioides sp.]HXH77350.1 cytochrome P450 [Nocardioides sp.]
MASEAAPLIDGHDHGHACPVEVESAETTDGRLGAVLGAPRNGELAPLGVHGPWLATSLVQAKQVLTDAAGFDFPSTVTRGSDMSGSAGDTRSGHHVFAPLTPTQVGHGSSTFLTQWHEVVAAARTSPDGGVIDAMQALRRPMARATCGAALPGCSPGDRDLVADNVLGWIDALGPVISRRRDPGRWSRIRRHEARARHELEDTLARVLPGCGINDAAHVVATFLAAGVQVPIAAGAWLLVLLAAHPERGFEPEHVVWESLRVAPPTWITARITTGPVTLAGRQLAPGELVLVSPLLLGRSSELVPGDSSALGAFEPDRWRCEDVRPGAWLPFGAGAHACPGRTLGFRLLRDLATWALEHELTLTEPVKIDQSRGILPSPARLGFTSPTQ